MCRWILMFLPDPEGLIARVSRALRPGGVFVTMEYFKFLSMDLWPDGGAFRRTYDAVSRLLQARGGEPDIGGRVPALFARHGLAVEETLPVLRVGRPGSELWRWLEATHVNHTNLVGEGLLTHQALDDYYREWDEASTTPGAFFSAPPLLITVGRKADGEAR